MGVTDGNRKKESGLHGVERGHPSLYCRPGWNLLHRNSVCTVDLRKKDALGLGSILTGNH